MRPNAVISLAVAVAASAWSVSAQTDPVSQNTTVTVRGCVAPAQRDGSLAPKPGATATPDTAPMEANNPEPIDTFMLLDATRVPADSKVPGHTTFALTGYKDLPKFNGARVEVAGTLKPLMVGRLPSGPASVADGVQRIQVSSIKRVAGNCSAKK